MVGSQSTLNCTIQVDSNGEVSSTDCTDESNDTVIADSSATCSFSPTNIQETIGHCDSYGTEYITNTTYLGYGTLELADYGDDYTFTRPHRANGHVFSYNVADADFDGVYDWTYSDFLVQETQTINKRIFANIYPEADDGVFSAEDEGHGVKIIELPADLSAYADFVTSMVERYDGDGIDDMSGLEIPIKHWAVANEPYCDSTDTDCQADILTLLETTYTAVKAADSNAVVFMGGAAPLIANDGSVATDISALYTYIFDNGGADYMDKFAFHIALGRDNQDLGTYVGLYNAMIGNMNMPMWVTETGPTDVNGTTTADFGADEWDWLEAHLSDASDLGIEKLFICNFLDLNADTDFWSDFTNYMSSL